MLPLSKYVISRVAWPFFPADTHVVKGRLSEWSILWNLQQIRTCAISCFLWWRNEFLFL